MKKLAFLKQTSLDRLQANILANQKRYLEEKSWLNSYFSSANWSLESNTIEVSRAE
jgi:hypothetical protein